ncbi:MAG TPA: zinc-binding dehydrogenase [Cyclobacteriaceae bacterium]|nr:zinc-binding dehydrogenase [Cyclobacteriaceae bacterium]
MKTKAVRLHGKDDLRLDEFELPSIKEDEILAKVMADSLCMSSYKATKLGTDHKRIPKDVAERPVIIGHEFSGELVTIGKKWAGKFRGGSKFSIQPALNYKGSLDAPGYSYHYIGGDATYVVIPAEVMEMNCLLEYHGQGFFPAALSEPYSCVAGTFHAHYHTKGGSYIHEMGIVEGGNMAVLAGVGPMGMAALDYVIHCDRRPKFIAVTDINEMRIKRAEQLIPVEEAARFGVELKYFNTTDIPNPVKFLRDLTGDNGYDDVLIFAPVRSLVEQANAMLGLDGCLNFFAGPSDPNFKAEFNFYDAHYHRTHIVGTSGGNTDDMIESLEMMSKDLLHPEILVTHIGGLNAVPETTKNLPNIPGGKKLMYTHLNLPLTAIEDFGREENPLFQKLHEICSDHGGLWSLEAEKYLIENAERI